MTHDEIRAAIAASAELQALVPDTSALATALSNGRIRFVETEVGNGVVLETLGLTTGNALLDALNSETSYRHVLPLLEQGRLRLDSALARASLQAMVGTVLTQVECDAMLAVAQVADPVSEFDVRCAIYADDGTLRV
ncbi:MAG: hypothetical protein WC322_05995 [Candidatus Paceibacterota bacterium]|jgi:hypothetical protein